MGGLFPRFPGSCDRYLGDFDVTDCDLICEPFAGSGSLTISRLGKNFKKAIIADADPSVRVCYQLYQNIELDPLFQALIADWKKAFSRNPKRSWNNLRQAMQELIELRKLVGPDIPYMSAVSHAFRALSFASIVRTGKASQKINVSMGKEQLEGFERRQFNLPYLPVGSELELYAAYRDAIAAIPEDAKAFVLVDPPYFGKMEPCYPGHHPRDPKTLKLFFDALKAALDHPGVYRILAKNYTTPELESELEQMDLGDWHLAREVKGKLTVGKSGKDGAGSNKEVFWYFDPHPRVIPQQCVISFSDLDPSDLGSLRKERDRLARIAKMAPDNGWIETGAVKGRNFKQAWWRGSYNGKKTIYIGSVKSPEYRAAISARDARKDLKKIKRLIAKFKVSA